MPLQVSQLVGWSGDEDEPRDAPAWAPEMNGFFETLASRYPGIEDHLHSLEDALDEGDDGALSAAVEDLARYMNKGMSGAYPKLTKAERRAAGERIAHHHRHLGRHKGGRRQAIAIGIREAAPDKYSRYARRHRKG